MNLQSCQIKRGHSNRDKVCSLHSSPTAYHLFPLAVMSGIKECCGSGSAKESTGQSLRSSPGLSSHPTTSLSSLPPVVMSGIKERYGSGSAKEKHRTKSAVFSRPSQPPTSFSVISSPLQSCLASKSAVGQAALKKAQDKVQILQALVAAQQLLYYLLPPAVRSAIEGCGGSGSVKERFIILQVCCYPNHIVLR